MAKKKLITNAMRMLSAEKIEFEAIEYDGEGLLDGDDFGGKIAELTGIEPERSFKTLVARGEKKGVMVFCIPVNAECDLKKAAKVSGNKSVEMIHVKDLLGLTGYVRGGCSPIGMKKQFPTYIEQSCENFEKITVSAGIKGCQLLVDRAKLVEFTRATVSTLTV